MVGLIIQNKKDIMSRSYMNILKWLVIILFICVTEPSDSLNTKNKGDSKRQLKVIILQQKAMNAQLDTLWKILKIDTTLRKK